MTIPLSHPINDNSCHIVQTVSEIKFSSYGDPQEKCGSFKKGSREASNSFCAVENACIGRDSCSIDASAATFGLNNVGIVNGRLVVEAVC